MASKDVTHLFKQYYGRNPNKDEMNYWGNKDPFQLRDALVKSQSPEKANQVKKIFEQYLGKGANFGAKGQSNEDVINYWSGKDFDQLRKQLDADSRSEIYSTNQAINEQVAKQKAQDEERGTYYKKEFKPAWKEEFDQEEADYKDTLKGANDRIESIKRGYKVAMERGDANLARNLKRMHDDYKTKVGQMVEDRDVYTRDLERKTGQNLKSADVSYAERGLFRSGAREGKKEYIQEQAGEQQSKYQREYDRRSQAMQQEKQRQKSDWNRTWNEGKSDLKFNYRKNLGQATRGKQSINRDWNKWNKGFNTQKQVHKAGYMQEGKADSLLGNNNYQGINWKSQAYNF